MADVQKLIDDIKSLTLMEAADIAKRLKEELGLPDPAPMMAFAGGAPAAEAAEEKTEFDVILESVPADKKIGVLKVVREITGLGLAEAKAFVESTPKPVKEGIPQAEANDIKAKIVEAGGVVKIA